TAQKAIVLKNIKFFSNKDQQTRMRPTSKFQKYVWKLCFSYGTIQFFV
ncbi:unnamed protein product, partial [Allacma fusca]